MIVFGYLPNDFNWRVNWACPSPSCNEPRSTAQQRQPPVHPKIIGTVVDPLLTELMPSLRFTSAMLSYVLLSLTSAGRRSAGTKLASAFSLAAPPAASQRSSLQISRRAVSSTSTKNTTRSPAACASSPGTKLHYRQDHADDQEEHTDSPMRVNLMTMPLPEMEELVVAWGFPKFRAKQIQGWIRDKGVSDI